MFTKRGFQEETDRQTDTQWTDIATYRLNRPKGQFSEKLAQKNSNVPGNQYYTKIMVFFCFKNKVSTRILSLPQLLTSLLSRPGYGQNQVICKKGPESSGKVWKMSLFEKNRIKKIGLIHFSHRGFLRGLGLI